MTTSEILLNASCLKGILGGITTEVKNNALKKMADA